MRRLDVIALAERLQRDLPVARHHDALAPDIAHLLEFIRRQLGGSGLEEFLEALGLRVHADKDPAAPAADTDRTERDILVRQGRAPICAIDDIDRGAIERPFPAMIFAVEAAHLAAPFGQPATAVRADIVKGRDLARLLADD